MGEKERAFVAALYPGEGWKQKVAKMPDDQVVAIYIGKKKAENVLKVKPKESKPNDDTLF